MEIKDLIDLVDELFPTQNKFPSENFSQLLDTLRYFNLTEIAQIREIIQRYRVDLIYEDVKETNRVLGQRKLTAEQLAELKNRGFRNRCQLVERALIREFGFRVQIFLNRQDPRMRSTINFPLSTEEGSFVKRVGFPFHPLPILFRYFDQDGAMASLESGKLRLKSPLIFDDLFDFQISPNYAFTKEQLKERLHEDLYNASAGHAVPRDAAEFFASIVGTLRKQRGGVVTREEIETKYGEVIQHSSDDAFRQLNHAKETWALLARYMRVVCFSANPRLPNMWALYAQKSAGIVLGFSQEERLVRNASPVSYVNSPPLLANLEEWIGNYGGWKRFDLEVLFSPLVFSKDSNAWGNQEEWRTVVLRRDWLVDSLENEKEQNLYDDIDFNPLALKQIIFGAKCDIQFRSQILDIIKKKYPHVEILECYKIENSFNIHIRKVGSV